MIAAASDGVYAGCAKGAGGGSTITSYYNIFTVEGTAASRVFFRIVAKAVRMRESWPDVHLQGPLRPYESQSASLSFAAFDLCRLSRHTGAPVSSNRLDRQ